MKRRKICVALMVIFFVSGPRVVNSQSVEYRIPEQDCLHINQILENNWGTLYLEDAWRIIDASFPPITDFHERAVVMNRSGFEYYQNNKYRLALALFSYAAHTEPGYQYGSYNAACSISLIIRESGEEYPELAFNSKDSMMIEYLQQAISVDPSYRQKMLIDPDFAHLHNDLWFLQLAGAVETRTARGISQLLSRGDVWYCGSGQGVYPPGLFLVFNDDGTVRINNRVDFIGAEEVWGNWQGTWVAYDGYLIITLDGNEYRGYFEDTSLIIPEFPFLMDVDVFTTEAPSSGC